MIKQDLINNNIDSVLKSPPSFITRIGTFFIILILIISFSILDSIKIFKTFKVLSSIILVSSSSNRITHVVLNVSAPKEKIIVKDHSAILNIVTSNTRALDLSIQGSLDSLNSEKGLAYFSFFDSLNAFVLIKQFKFATLQINHVESSYFKIVKQKIY